MFSAMGVGFMRLLARLPLTWVRGLGTALGWVLYRVVPARRRVLQVWALAGLLMLLRPLWPQQLLPGWLVGGVLLWAVVELLLSRGVSTDVLNSFGGTALDTARWSAEHEPKPDHGRIIAALSVPRR